MVLSALCIAKLSQLIQLVKILPPKLCIGGLGIFRDEDELYDYLLTGRCVRSGHSWETFLSNGNYSERWDGDAEQRAFGSLGINP
jgi:hypothetical protein